ncbi:MAG TPA: hypothetical protein VGY55_19110 [Pirellulales bacterium]|jgi:hypothetical protein|nr:hypothetical protein [Pirellulales bacterium]
MRRLLLAATIGLSLGATSGCILPAYSGDPPRRTAELLNTSEDLRLLLDEWERFWFLDEPSHMTEYRSHGGVL